MFKKEIIYTDNLKIRYTIFGLKFLFKIKKQYPSDLNLWKIKNLGDIPFIFQNNFWKIKEFPMFSSDYTMFSDSAQLPSIGVVIQGNIIKKNDFTLETCKIYKRIFNNGEKIILSTWDDEDSKYLEKFKELGVIVVLSTKPKLPAKGNVNYQIVSTVAGCKKAKELNSEYILKTRTDQRFYLPNISLFLINMLKQYPLKVKCDLKERLIALSYNSFKYRYYGVSDMFLFGNSNDVLKYWDIPLFNNIDEKNINNIEIFQKYCPETMINVNFLKNLNLNPDYTLEQSIKFYRDYFCFVDKEQLGFFWGKYTNNESRWDIYLHNYLEEFRFVDWLNLYFETLQPSQIAQSLPDYFPMFK